MGTSSEIVKNYTFRFIILALVPSYALYLLGYQTLRSDTYRLWFLMLAALLPFIVLTKPNFQISFKSIFILGIWLRLILLFSTPALSDDYFRFIWDGRLNFNGVNPFLHVPKYYLEQGFPINGIHPAIYQYLNSKEYFSIYPPICQLIFWIGSIFSTGSILGHIIVMRVFFLLAESASIYFLYLILMHLKIKYKKVIWYALNPLVVIEITGNLHFEAFMIMGVLGSIYFLFIQKKWIVAALFFAVAVNSKMLPLMLLPLFFFPLGIKKAAQFYTITIVFVVLMFLPFLSKEALSNISDSVGLYFQKFEFNASLYYIVRWFGYQQRGYNIIETAGKTLSLIPVFFILLLLFLRGKNVKSIFVKMLWVYTIYFFSATIIHPWYIVTLVAFCILTPYRYPIWWLVLAMLSYATYQTTAYTENLWLTTIEYLIVYGIAFYELYRHIAWRKELQLLYNLKHQFPFFTKKP